MGGDERIRQRQRARGAPKLSIGVAYAFVQVMKTGSEAQVASAREVLVRTRKDLYRILADGEGDADTVKEDS